MTFNLLQRRAEFLFPVLRFMRILAISLLRHARSEKCQILMRPAKYITASVKGEPGDEIVAIKKITNSNIARMRYGFTR